MQPLILLVGCQEGHPACKNCVMRCWYDCLECSADDFHMVQPMPLPPSQLASLNSRMAYLISDAVLEKRQLNSNHSEHNFVPVYVNDGFVYSM